MQTTKLALEKKERKNSGMGELASEMCSKSMSYLNLVVGALSKYWQIGEGGGRQSHMAGVSSAYNHLTTQHSILYISRILHVEDNIGECSLQFTGRFSFWNIKIVISIQ